ncbi:MAG: polymerase [Rhodospirillales bacterium]|nr:polymerase [Rhodospirillales bacterium]
MSDAAAIWAPSDPAPTRLCRDCGRLDRAERSEADACPACGSARVVQHDELASLTIAHVDCDAYYASIEKRDRPELTDRPLIVGGGERGVVTTCCYIARRFGVHSAMPMSRALRLCPDAVVLRPDMEKYKTESRRIAELMRAVAPMVEQVSIDEAYLDLGTADARAQEPPARSLARLALQIEKRIGVTVSIGLAPNKMLAKLASDLDKPRGFSIIGESDALDVIGRMKIGRLPGVGPVMARRLGLLDLNLVADLRQANQDDLRHRFGIWARRLVEFAHGQDARKVAGRQRRSVTVGAETTFNKDLRTLDEIDLELRPLCDLVAARLKRADLAAGSLTLKLRRTDWKTITRACRLHDPTANADVIWQSARRTLADELDGASFRLVGVAGGQLVPGRQGDPPDLFDRARG